jgi:O-antigen/teichoic acid export membrane protein
LSTTAQVPSNGRLSLLYLIGAAIQGLAPILVQPVVIRSLDLAQWGRVGVATAMLQVGLVILSAGVPLAVTRTYFQTSDGPRRSRAIIAASALFSIGAALVVTMVWGLVLLAQRDLEENLPFLITVPAVGLLSVVVAAQAHLRAEKKAVKFVLLSAGSSLGAHTLGLASVLLVQRSATVYLTAFAIGMSVTAVVALLLVKPISAWHYARPVWDAVRISLPLVPHSLAMILIMQGDGLLLKLLEGDVAAGRYIAAAAFALGPFAVLAGLNNVWTPRIMAASNGAGFREELRAVTRQAAATSFLLGFLGIAGANVGIWVLAGDMPDLIQVAKVLPLVSTGYALYLIGMAALFALGRTGAFAYVTLGIALAAALIAIIPIQSQNFLLLAGVKAGVFAALGLIYLLLSRRAGAVGLSLRPFLMTTTVLIILALAALFIPTTLAAGIVTLVVSALLAAAVVAVVVVRKRRRKAV